MALSSKEKSRRYRERVKNENPEKYAVIRKTNLARITLKRKRIAEMTKAEAKSKREDWRRQKRKLKGISKKKSDAGITETEEPERKECRIQKRVQGRSSDSSAKSVPKVKTAAHAQKTEEEIKKIKHKLQLSQKQNQKKKALNKALTEKMNTTIERYKKRIKRLKEQSRKSIDALKKSLGNEKARNKIIENAIKHSSRKHSERLMKKVDYNSNNLQDTSKMLGLKVTSELEKADLLHDLILPPPSTTF